MATSSSSSQPHWETIRPWLDRLSMQIKDLTSISATFVLTSATHEDSDEWPSNGIIESSLFKASVPVQGCSKHGGDAFKLNRKPISPILDRGFTIKVNGLEWTNYFVNVEDDGDEAVIILYGLRPGRSYDVEFVIEQTQVRDDGLLKTEFATPKSEEAPTSAQEPDVEECHDSTPPTPSSKSPTPPLTPPPVPVSLHSTSTPQADLDHLATLQQTRSALSQEAHSLTTQLKLARKESQRAEASTKAEIDAIKKASEKAGAGDLRTKQKILALQEAVKQALASTGTLEEQAKEVEESLMGVKEDEKRAEEENAKIKGELEEKNAQVDSVIKADRKRISDLQSELSSLSNRVDKLTTKRDKLEKDTISDLDTQLIQLRKEIEETERERENYLNPFPFGGVAPTTGHTSDDPLVVHGLASLRSSGGVRLPNVRQNNGRGSGNFGMPYSQGQMNGAQLSSGQVNLSQLNLPQLNSSQSNPTPAATGQINPSATPFYPSQERHEPLNRMPLSLSGVRPVVMNDFRPFENVIPGPVGTGTSGPGVSGESGVNPTSTSSAGTFGLRTRLGRSSRGSQ